MKTFALAAVLAVSVTTAGTAKTIDSLFSSFYALGDSLSDDGKGLAPAASPYFGTRFTNGETWAEDIENAFTDVGKDTKNYALGGATASGPDLGADNPARGSNLTGQVNTLLEDVAFGNINPGDTPLVSVWMGANDLFGLAGSPFAAPLAGSDDELKFLAEGVAGLVALSIGQLALNPVYQFENFLVPNLPDLDGTPLYTLAAPEFAANAAIVTEAYNSALSTNLAALEASLGITIFEVDTNALFDEISGPDNPLGLLDRTNPCVFEALDINCAPSDPSIASFFLFQDLVHPTRPAHALLAARATELIEAELAPVPLPATGLLLIAGIGILGAQAQRKARA